MENEFECLVVRRGRGGNFAEKFVKTLFLARVITFITMLPFILPLTTRQTTQTHFA